MDENTTSFMIQPMVLEIKKKNDGQQDWQYYNITKTLHQECKH